MPQHPVAADLAQARFQPRPDGRGRGGGDLLVDDHPRQAGETTLPDPPGEGRQGRIQGSERRIQPDQAGAGLGQGLGGGRRIGGRAQASTDLPFLITTASRSFTRASKETTPPSRQRSTVTVSPGNTGAEKRAWWAFTLAGSKSA